MQEESIQRIRLQWDEVRSCTLRSLVIIANAEGTLFAETVGPEAIDGSRVGHGVMSEEKPETEDGLGKDVEDSVGDDFTVDVDVAGSVGDTPDAETDQLRQR